MQVKEAVIIDVEAGELISQLRRQDCEVNNLREARISRASAVDRRGRPGKMGPAIPGGTFFHQVVGIGSCRAQGIQTAAQCTRLLAARCAALRVGCAVPIGLGPCGEG